MTEPRQTIESDTDGSAAAAAEVEALLSTMGKALRAFNMYQDNNPVFQRFKTGLREAFEAVWTKTDELMLGVAEEGFRYGGRTYSVGQGRENLAFAFYKDGVRSLTFLRGFEDEVADFMDAVNRAMKGDHDADDLISVLWERDFSSLQYGYVDLLMEGLSLPEEPLEEAPSLEGAISLELADEGEGPEGEEEEQETGTGASGPEPRAGLSRDDFDDTLYFLDPAEIATLQEEVEIEMERDVRADVLKALFDRLEEHRPERQGQILDILDQLLPLFLSRGDLAKAAVILDELDHLQEDGRTLDEPLRERVEQLFARLSDPGVLEQFVQAVEDGAVAPDSGDVTLFFSRLGADALPILIRFAEMSESEAVRTRLSSAIDGLAGRHTAEVNRLLGSEEPAVVTGAARVAGRVGLAHAVPGLHSALKHPDPGVRLVVVRALLAIRVTAALNALTTALEDDDRDVRVTAAQALGAVRFASAAPALEAVLDGKRIKDADLTEKMAFFQAYGAAGGGAAVDRLSRLLNGKGFLGRRPSTEIRACAALGLGHTATPEARSALERAKSDEDPIVRNAVVRALNEELVTR